MDLIHAIHEPAGAGPFPTIFALHGWGANALDLLGLAPLLASGRLLVIAPQGPLAVPLGPPGGGGPSGFGWFPLLLSNPPTPASVAEAVAQARSFIDQACDRYPVSSDRIAVLGFSQGGVLAYALGLSDPRRFRALVALSTWLPDDLLSALPSDIDRSRLDALVQHGARDEIVAATRGKESARKLEQLGVRTTYHEYEGMGHEINPRSLRILSRWLDEHL